ncbi:hypothetical protein EHS25_008508 [Saitozyma podzolica]|uniref:Chromosome segregation in meiosis protein n=1 Tax=Saitozyma podzolica TaxID=1890683 RepID=A0A427YLZ7_9TREE|nr:hypothetical protein EHS25_008508 [Saitozyma podzolica]
MSDSLLDLFNSPPAPPPRLPSRSPSHSRSPSPGPSRLPTSDSAPLFLSPGSVSSTPARPKRARDVPTPPRQPLFSYRAGREDPVVNLHDLDFDGEWDIDAPLPDLPRPLRDPREETQRYDLPLGLDGGGLGDLDPFKDLHGQDEEEQGGKKRRVMPKIDADRLMSDRGFPALMKSAKKFKPRGKGQEAKDLRDLLGIYQIWAHGMFPKGDFASTIARVEVVCRTRRMENMITPPTNEDLNGLSHSALKGYREAFYPPPRSPSPDPTGERDTRLTPSREDHEHDLPPTSDAAAPVGRSSQPLFDEAPDDALDGQDEPDMDELMAMEEMERVQGGASGADGADSMQEKGNERMVEEDEWEGLYD